MLKVRNLVQQSRRDMTEANPNPIAAVPYVVIGSDGDHHLMGSRCGHCGATLLGKRVACAACGESDRITEVRLADTGRVRICSVINRSYPGVPVPFIAAVVEIDGGGILRGTLAAPIPVSPLVEIGRPVRICIEDTGQRDSNGRPFYSHIFRPAET